MQHTRRQLLTLLSAAALATPVLATPQPPKLPAQKAIKLFGATIRYYEFGRAAPDRPTLVLLHGLGSSAAGDWGQVMPALAKTHHVLALDHLGFGNSDKPFIQYGIQTWVDFLGEFLREKQVSDGFQLMGESLGGWIAAQYTLQALRNESVGESFQLRKPARLVLADAAGFREAMAGHFEPSTTPSKTGAGPSLAGEKALLARIFRAPSFNTEAAIRNGMGWSISKGDSFTIGSVYGNPAILNESVDGQLGGITIPTLVVWGQHDALLPLALGERYAREIPGARLVIVPDSGHAPMIETPAAFLAALGDFLNKP